MNLTMNSGASGQSWTERLSIALKRWWAAYKTLRAEQAAIIHLSSMSDVQLKDLGLTRSQISSVVKGDASRSRTFRLYY